MKCDCMSTLKHSQYMGWGFLKISHWWQVGWGEMPGLIWGVMSTERTVPGRTLHAAACKGFFTGRLQTGTQDRYSFRNVQPEFRCDLFVDPQETARGGGLLFFASHKPMYFSIFWTSHNRSISAALFILPRHFELVSESSSCIACLVDGAIV